MTDTERTERTGPTTTETTEATTTAEPGHPYWLTGPCPPWCSTFHLPEDHPDDRLHISDEKYTYLSTEPSQTVFVDHEMLGKEDQSVVYAYLSQNYREVSPRVALSVNGAPSSYLTVGEAANLRDTLTELIDTASTESTEK